MQTLSSTSHDAVPGSTPPAGRGVVLSLPSAAIQGPAGLRGRRLGVAGDRTAAALRGFEAALARAGLTLADADPVDIGAHPLDQRWTGTAWDVEANALLRGEVDAVFVGGAHGAEIAAAIGATTVVDLGAGGQA
jgi:ABC-type nitrate/sulfonate/bicarbonate transport system substrate-binding protein